MTPSAARLCAELDEIFRQADIKPLPKPRPRRPKLICVNGVVIAAAVVIVSPKDVNWWRGMAVRRNGEIHVRPDWRRV
jgi:hypothetical protein